MRGAMILKRLRPDVCVMWQLPSKCRGQEANPDSDLVVTLPQLVDNNGYDKVFRCHRHEFM